MRKRGYFGIVPTLLLSDSLSSLEQKIIASLLSLPEEQFGFPPTAITNITKLARAFHVTRRAVYQALRGLQNREWIQIEKLSRKRTRIGLTEKFVHDVVEASPSPVQLEIFEPAKPKKEKRKKSKSTRKYSETRKRVEAILSRSLHQQEKPIDLSQIPGHILEDVYERYSVHVQDYERTSPDWLYWELKKALFEAQQRKN